MKLHLEAIPGELETKSEALVEAVTDLIRPANPDLAESLEKALPKKESDLKFPVLREVKATTDAIYQKHLKAMLEKIYGVLDEAVVKADLEEGDFPGDTVEVEGEFGKALYIGPRGGKWADPEHTIPWDPDKHGGQVAMFDLKAKPKEKSAAAQPPAKTDDPKTENIIRDIIRNDPALTPEQKSKALSAGLMDLRQRITKNASADMSEWDLPAGARIDDPWEPKTPPPDQKWSHPDFGEGTGVAPWQEPGWSPDFHKYDYVIVNSSAGKDSQAMLSRIVALADEVKYPREKLIVVHADLGRVEWEGTLTLAREQAEHYGLRFEVVQRQQNDLVDQIEERYWTLLQRNKDVEVLANAGIKSWADLEGSTWQEVLKIIGEGKGTSKWDGEHRAKEMVKKAKSKRMAKENKHNRKLKSKEGAVASATKRIEVARTKLKNATTDKQKATAKASLEKNEARLGALKVELKELKDLGDPKDWPVDYGEPIPWPSTSARFCTSDHKTVEVDKLITQLAKDAKESGGVSDRPVKVLNALGIRAQESDNREKMDNFGKQTSTSNQDIDRWYPIHQWSEKEVWKEIADSGVPFHKAYALGMRRLSCVFCVYASREDLMIAAVHNPDLFNTYLELEEKVGSEFRKGQSLADVAAEIQKRRDAGYELNELAEWVKKALGLDEGQDSLVKAMLRDATVTQADLVIMLLEAALTRLQRKSQTIQTVTLEWKPKGVCVHLDTATDSHHVSYLDYPEAYNASMAVAAFAQKHSLEFEEHNIPGPMPEDDIEKSLHEMMLDRGWVEVDPMDLEKAQTHKYIRRVAVMGKNGRKRYRYYYRESAAARGPTAGEDVKIDDQTTAKIKDVSEDGTVKIEINGKEQNISPEGWATLMAKHYGDVYHHHAEKRARQAINAVLKHVPKEILVDLKGETDKERLADLKERVPKVYDKLDAAFSRAGVSPFQAKDILEFSLKRRGWESEARAALVGSVLTEEGAKAATQVKTVARGAERLAGGKPVTPGNVQAAIELRKPQIEDVAKKAERDLARLQTMLQEAAKGGDRGKMAGILAQAMAFTSDALQQMNDLATAYPSGDEQANEVRDAVLKVPSAQQRDKPTTEGSGTTVFVAGEGGKAVGLKARYKLVEASEVKASHDPTKGFKATEDYPEGVQERAYHRDRGEQDKVQRNARRLNPEFLVNTNPDAVNGPPMITEDGIVLGGNSRTMSMQVAYNEDGDKAAELRKYLEEHAHEVGLQAQDVKAMKNPVLVRVVEVEDKSKENLQLLVRQMNESFTQAMDPRTMQVAMARKLDDQTMKSLTGNMREDETLNEFLGSSRAKAFLANLRRVGIIDERNANQFFSKVGKREKFNEDGKTLVARILVGNMLDDADLLSETRPKLLNSIARSVPLMVQATEAGDEYDLGKSVQVAMNAMNRIQVKVDDKILKPLDAKMKDREIQSLLDNEFSDMFGDKHPILEDERAQELFKLFIKRPGPVQMAGVFKEYAKLAAANPTNQGGLGLTESRSPEEVFKLAITSAIDKEAKAEAAKAAEEEQKAKAKEQGGLFGKSLEPALTEWLEVPAQFVEAVYKAEDWSKDSLEKAAGHKYIRRVPYTGKDGKRRYRYFYKVTGGQGLAHKAEIVEGAKFKVGGEEHAKGHFTVVAVEGDQVQVKHDETGDTHMFTKKAFQLMLHHEHGEEIRAKYSKISKDLMASRVYGTEAQQKALEAQLSQFQALFDKVLYSGSRKPPRQTAPKPPKWYHETQRAEDAANLLQSKFQEWTSAIRHQGEMEGQPVHRVTTTVTEVPLGVQNAAKAFLQALKDRYGEDFDKAFYKVVKTNSGGGFYQREYLEKLAAGDVSIFHKQGQAVGDPINLYDVSDITYRISEWESSLGIERAKMDLKIDAKEELRGDVALFVSELREAARNNYFNEGLGTRAGLDTVRDMLGQIRTARGMEAMKFLMHHMNNKNVASHKAMQAARGILGYKFDEVSRAVVRRSEALENLGLSELVTTVNRPTPTLMEAIAQDVAAIREQVSDPENRDLTTVRVASGSGREAIPAVEQDRHVVDHRFSQLGPNSAVSQAFQKEFGVTIHLDDTVFDNYFEVPYVTDRDYNQVDVKQGLYIYTDAEKKEFNKKLQKLSEGDRKKVRRWLARHKAQYGLHGSELAAEGAKVRDYAENADKAAFREFQMAADMSYEARVEALQNVWNALADMKAVMGDNFDLSNLPLVISQRHVSAGAMAHYSGETYPEALDREKLVEADPARVQADRIPHIALGMGLEKALAHEISHYLENRISLRVGDVMRGFNQAVTDAIEEVSGGKGRDSSVLTENQHLIHLALIKASGRGDGKYMSSLITNLIKLQKDETYKSDPEARAFADKVLDKVRKLPTAEEHYQLIKGIQDTGVLDRLQRRDEADKKGGSVAALMAEMAGQSKENIRDYWSNGTEIVARAIEQHIYYQTVEKKALNPTLTHMIYDESHSTQEGDEFQYLTPEEYKTLKPRIEAVLAQVQENMTKSEDPEEDFEDHTQAVAEKDERAYRRVKQVLVNRGFKMSDFDRGGPFYGWSVNQLIDFARGKGD